MGHLFAIGMFVCAVVSLARPWVGVVYAYLFVVLAPQNVWFWDFAGLRPVMWVLLPTCIGVIFGLLRVKFDFSILLARRNLFILVLWLCFVMSYYLGPYTAVPGPYRFSDPDDAIATLNKIMLLYFIACLCIDTEQKLKVLFYVVAGSATYLVYWANDQYLTGHWLGRLAGPVAVNGGGIYSDENNFAMLFVVAQSFLWYMGLSLRTTVLRWACWLIIPFCWHAVFLTASRGGLIGLGTTTLLISLRSRRKLLGLALIPAFVFVYLWQAGSVMKTRAETISDYRTEASAATRLESWRAAAGMIADHPLTGVGLASYGPAFPHYSDKHPREAHDTVLQIAAESGVVAGAMYVLVVLSSIVPLWRNGNRFRSQNPAVQGSMIFAINEATLIGLCGLVVCSLFLSLQRFEIFYCLNVLTNAVLYLSAKGSTAPTIQPAVMLATDRQA